jgi:hypothetical protein
MPLNEIGQQILGVLREHAVKVVTGFVVMAVGWYIARRRAQDHWEKQQFFDRLNVSLNSIDAGTLKIRTLSEKRCEDVFLNSVAADTVQKLARRTTAKDPVLPIPLNDSWFYLNAVLNEISEQFAAGLMKRDMGAPVASAVYLVVLTCEAAGDMRTRKIRAMVTKKSLLTNLPAEMPKLESGHHGTRWQTLQFLAAEYARHPQRFLEVELCV